MGLRRRDLAEVVERLEEEVQALTNRIAGLERSSATAREELQRLHELTIDHEAERERAAATIAELHSGHQHQLARIREDVAAQDSALSALESLLASRPIRQIEEPDVVVS